MEVARSLEYLILFLSWISFIGGMLKFLRYNLMKIIQRFITKWSKYNVQVLFVQYRCRKLNKLENKQISKQF